MPASAGPGIAAGAGSAAAATGDATGPGGLAGSTEVAGGAGLAGGGRSPPPGPQPSDTASAAGPKIRRAAVEPLRIGGCLLAWRVIGTDIAGSHPGRQIVARHVRPDGAGAQRAGRL